MDQLRTALDVLKKHYFWFLTGIMVLVAVLFWYRGTGGLADEAQTKRRNLDSKFSQVEQVLSRPDHPNDQFATKVRDLVAKAKSDIRSAHSVYWEQQQQISGPSQFLPPVVRDRLADLEPGEPIAEDLRLQYRDEVVQTFNRLFESAVDLREQQEMEMEDDAKGDKEKRRDFTGLVVWPDEKRKTLAELYRWENVPTSLQVRYSMQDYWVYRELLRVISEINAGAKDHLAAAVKEIIALEIGRWATGGVREGASLTFLFTDDPVQQNRRGGRRDQPRGRGSQRGAAGGNQPQQLTGIDAFISRGRYVNENGVPLEANQPQPFAQFKLLPIRLALVVDQRRIPKVLSELANAKVPIEVLQVRFNPHEEEYFRPYSTSSDDRGEVPKWGSPGSGAQGLEAAFHDVRLEVRAMLYIFNQPPEQAPTAEEGEAGSPGTGGPTGTEATGPVAGTSPAAASPETDTDPAADSAGAAPVGGDDATPAAEPGTEPGGSPEAPPATKAGEDDESPPSGEGGAAPAGEEPAEAESDLSGVPSAATDNP